MTDAVVLILCMIERTALFNSPHHFLSLSKRLPVDASTDVPVTYSLNTSLFSAPFFGAAFNRLLFFSVMSTNLNGCYSRGLVQMLLFNDHDVNEFT